jgi:hypothetical protein
MWFLNRVEGAEEGFHQFVTLQYEMAWNASGNERNIAQAGEVKAGVSHPDFGKKWEQLTPLVKDFFFRLCVLRALHFREVAKAGRLPMLLALGRGQDLHVSHLFRPILARRLHDDWVRLRAALYSYRTPEERRRLVDAGITPFGEHENDIDWREETPAQQENDLRLFDQLSWLLAYCAESPERSLQAFVESLSA